MGIAGLVPLALLFSFWRSSSGLNFYRFRQRLGDECLYVMGNPSCARAGYLQLFLVSFIGHEAQAASGRGPRRSVCGEPPRLVCTAGLRPRGHSNGHTHLFP
ncbi:hypothetical protein FB567DRAFT_541564 [Paraphoma chrysanthemicola]|uniref:Secreted protein n=1 Tax=Paraphoma chrysanthemicola TaxID=798071 RepID=A0A8K0QRL1_9PLEO|nr:hypothetical protein FB567DRAFT_541564 [Paraphoma chrysanthemicola]